MITQDNETDFQNFSVCNHYSQIEFFCKTLQINLVIYKTDNIINIGSGLELELYESDSYEYGIIIEKQKLAYEPDQDPNLDFLFTHLLKIPYINELQELEH